MRLNSMKKAAMLLGLSLFSCIIASAQVQYTAGPELDNDRDNKMNRMLGGDATSFYCYRIRSRGRGTSFYIEKYDKKKLTPVFSKEISLEDGDDKTKIEDVLYSNGNVYVFRRSYDKAADKMTLYFQTVSSTGQVSTKLVPITVVSTDHYEFVDFDIYQNPSKTKFMVKSSHKPNKAGEWLSDFMLLDATTGMSKTWTKTIKRRLVNKDYSWLSSFTFGAVGTREDLGFIGLHFDDKDNVYYCYTEDADRSTEKERRYRLYMGVLNAAENDPKTVEIKFDDDYWVRDIEFLKTNDNEIVVAGYVKDVIERRGRDLVKVGLFSYKINLVSYSIAAKAMNFFDDKMLTALESSPKKSRYFKYKLDYILPVGDAVYYVGEQYSETYYSSYNSTGFGSTRSSYWGYEYMDVIVAKLNAQGQFEWIKNVPLRNNMRMSFAHVFKQYIAIPTDKDLYILCNDHPKNIDRYESAKYEPEDLKSVTTIHGSNFVCNQLNLATGAIKRSVIFENENYCFAPIQERNPQFIPPSECEIFVFGDKNEIFVYTEDKGRDQFGRLKFK